MKANKLLVLSSLIGLGLLSFDASAHYVKTCSGGGTPKAPNYGGGCSGNGYVFDRAEAANGVATSDVGDLNMKIASYSETTRSRHVTTTTNYVLFKFQNIANDKTSITDLYFGGNTESLFTGMGIAYSSFGSYFTKDSVAMALPDVTDTPFDVASDYSFGSRSSLFGLVSATSNGVNKVGEYVTLWGVLANGKTYSDVYNSLFDGRLTVGLELSTLVTNPKYCRDNAQQVIKTSYLNRDCVSPVPVPAAAWLFGSALLGFVTVSNRRRV